MDRRSANAGTSERERNIAIALLFVVPVLFSTNIITARAVSDAIPPFALAFWRWWLAFLLFLPAIAPDLIRYRHAILREWRDLLVLGILGMGICGAFVYVGADTTSATNIGLIYASAPILIAAAATLIYREPLGRTKASGILISLAGVLIIVFRGDLDAVRTLALVPGDLWIATAAIAWAIYSVMLRYRPSALPGRVRFAATMLYGALALLPFYAVEHIGGAPLRVNFESVAAILIVAIVPGLGAYLGYARIQRSLGASPTALILYLAPVYTALMAWLLLGEHFEAYHFVGAALILPGIFLSTRN
ncbi:MAG: DMT family transporter [Alphaproteobacteria bacterium]|nr:DMT family transporter [Alphaproteobacteria bacterium]